MRKYVWFMPIIPAVAIWALSGCFQQQIPTSTDKLTEAQAFSPSDPNACVFNRAVNLCGTLDKTGAGLTSSAFEGYGRGKETSGGAHVGINGAVDYQGSLKIDGNLEIGGEAKLGGTLLLKESLFIGGGLKATGHLTVDQDATVSSGIVNTGNLVVTGDLLCDKLTISAGTVQYGNLREESVPVDKNPVNCSQLIDIVSLVKNAAVNAQPFPALDPPLEVITLSEGDYYTDNMEPFTGRIKFTIEGAVRIFIDSDIENIGHESFKLTQDAQLDIYVNGNIQKVGRFAVGNVRQPVSRSVRIYIGGEEQVDLDLIGNTRLEACVYAPLANIRVMGSMVIQGALFANSLTGSGRVWIIYDTPCPEFPSVPQVPEQPEQPEQPQLPNID